MKSDAKGWIRVEDGLPEAGEIVIVAYTSSYGGARRQIDVGEISSDYGWVTCEFMEDFQIENVTHWQPFPELPEGIEQEVLP